MCLLGCLGLALFSVTPIDVSGVALVESGGKFGSLTFYSPFFFFFFALLSLSPACCLTCPGLLLPLGWELLLCSSCCLARLRRFGSNLGSKHICSAFCFLPPSLLAVKHFIIQTLWKALYKMKLWGYLFWCSQSNSVSYFPPLIFSSLDNT